MKTFFLLVSCAFTSFAQPVNRKNIDLGWKYFRRDVAGAEKFGFDDSEWQTINLPHDASIEGPFDEKIRFLIQGKIIVPPRKKH